MNQNGWSWYERSPAPVRAAVAISASLACLIVPALLDQWGYGHLHRDRLYDHDWAMALRAAGTLYVWIPVALVLWLVQRERDAALARRRSLLVLGSPALAGLVCEVMKLLIRRERPDVAAGEWVFRAWNDHPFSSAGLATPSSHTMVAFGAATILSRLHPRGRWVFYAIAWGCGATRVLSHAHYVSDVTFGALLGWAVGWGVWMQWGMGKAEGRGQRADAGSPMLEAGRTTGAR